MNAKILILEDEPRMRRLLELVLKEEGHAVQTAADGREGIICWEKWQPDLVISDLKMPQMDGLEVLRYRNAHFLSTPFILLTAFGTVKTAVAAIKEGAFDYLTKPVDHKQLRELVTRALKEHGSHSTQQMIGSSPAMYALHKEIALAAATESSVLIIGESGTGKELAARAVHDAYGGKKSPFVRVNCPAIPSELLESELFGHKQGAFTGATKERRGAFAAADGGTLFLDEIGDLPLALQPKLLHAVEQKTVTPVGTTTPRKIQVKIIAATNRNLKKMIVENAFRQDLYYRLNTLTLHLPPLRERSEDIEALALFFIKQFCAKNGVAMLQLEKEALGALCTYGWPGNVRELSSVIERGCLRAENGFLTAELLSENMVSAKDEGRNLSVLTDSFDLPGRERELIMQALEQCYWNQTRAARQLGITRNTLRYRIKKYGIRKG
ncbi:MAG TPA: sigma-54-dependent Fis family transcriptional regulator [Desulfobulbus sp.]|nr:sigma-54-dependent Fis family transcriptional regulator [Desulfobulbus sp.]